MLQKNFFFKKQTNTKVKLLLKNFITDF